MDQHWTSRDYNNGDETHIIRLFNRVFSREISLSLWKWRFRENPDGKGIIKLMFDGDILIGHYAVIPMSVRVTGMSIKAALAMTSMTHPDYSGRGIFTSLAKEVWNVCQQQGFSFVYGFPNEAAHPVLTGRLGWEGIGKIVALRKILSGKPINLQTVAEIKNVERFDKKVDLLWDEVKNEYPVSIPRIEKYLNWRFSRNPDIQYQKYIISEPLGRILGYVVLKEYIRGVVKKGHIVDMLSVPNDEVIRMLVRHSCVHFKYRQITDISGWFPAGSRYLRVMEEEGFKAGKSRQNFDVRMLNDDGNLARIVTGALTNWYLTMGDSDVF
jgi:hypothetical protein